MSAQRKTVMRKRVRIIAVVFALASLLLLWLMPGGHGFGIALSAGLGIAAFSMLCAQCRNVVLEKRCG